MRHKLMGHNLATTSQHVVPANAGTHAVPLRLKDDAETSRYQISDGGYGSGVRRDDDGAWSCIFEKSAPRARLDGWPRVNMLRPSFETLASQASQDEVRIHSPAASSQVADICWHVP